MTTEGTGGRELSELVADHVLRDEDRDELVPVVNGNRMTDEVRADHRGASPSLDDGLLARFIHRQDLLLELEVDIWTFL